MSPSAEPWRGADRFALHFGLMPGDDVMAALQMAADLDLPFVDLGRMVTSGDSWEHWSELPIRQDEPIHMRFVTTDPWDALNEIRSHFPEAVAREYLGTPGLIIEVTHPTDWELTFPALRIREW